MVKTNPLAVLDQLPSTFSSTRDMLGERTVSGVNAFADTDVAPPPVESLMPTQETLAPVDDPTHMDLSKLNLAQPLEAEGFQTENKMGGRQTLTSDQQLGLDVAKSAVTMIGQIQNIKSQEREALSKMHNRFAENQVVKRLQRVDRDTSQVRRNLQALRELSKQAGAPQTAGSQHQQFFSSPTSGREL